jgi:hypothetical protein
MPAVRHQAGGSGSTPSLVNPLRDQGFVGTRGDAQLSRGFRHRFVGSSFAGTEQYSRRLGQQVGPAVSNLMQLGYRHLGLSLSQVAPLGVPLGRAAQNGYDQAVTVRSVTIMGHLTRIEHIDAKYNLNSENM